MKILTQEIAKQICEQRELVMLNLGCGPSKLDGFINIDALCKFQPDFNHDLSQPIPFPPNSVHVIVALDIFEHFDQYVRYMVMENWSSILVNKGGLFIRVPDFEFLISKWKKIDYEDFFENIYGELMAGSKSYTSHFGLHKWGYTDKTLIDFGKKFGIEFSILSIPKVHSIEVCGKSFVMECGYGINAIGYKNNNSEILYDNIKIKSYSNTYGRGKSYLTLNEVKSLINKYRL